MARAPATSSPWRRRTSRTASGRSRTSRRSPVRWRWWRRRACARPSSASRRCGRTRRAIRRMTRQAAEAAGDIPQLPILNEHDDENRVGLLLVTGDRGLAGAFNSQIIRAGVRAGDEHAGEGKEVRYYASGRRGVSSLTFRGRRPRRPVHRLHRPPVLRRRARHRVGPDGGLRRRRARPRGDLLQRLHLAADPEGHARDAAAAAAGLDPRGRRRGGRRRRAAAPATTTRPPITSARSSSTSPTRRRSSAGSSPPTSRSRSTARCSSRPRPSTARA